MESTPYNSEHRVPATERAQRLVLRAESREEQVTLALLARAIREPDWYEQLERGLDEYAAQHRRSANARE